MSTKPTLKCKTETVISVNTYDLETFIEQVTGHEYEIQASEEWGNDSHHRFDINGKLQSYQQKDWDNFKKDGDHGASFKLRTYLEGLCQDGFLKPGIYVVSLSY